MCANSNTLTLIQSFEHFGALFRSVIRVKRRMAIPKYLDVHLWNTVHSRFLPYLSFGDSIGDKRQTDLSTLLRSRGFGNISSEDRFLIYHNSFQHIYSGLPVEAIDEREYSANVDITLLLKSSGFRKDLLTRIPLPGHDNTRVWATTISLLRYIKHICERDNLQPQQSAYWLMEHIFQFPELTRYCNTPNTSKMLNHMVRYK